MTKELRFNVSDQVSSANDLVSGDKVIMSFRKGLQVEQKIVFTYGYRSGVMLKTEDHEDACLAENLRKTPPGWDSLTLTVWRKLPELPTNIGAIIHIDETHAHVREFKGLVILRSAGSWQGVHNPTLRFGAANIKSWSPVKIEVTN